MRIELRVPTFDPALVPIALRGFAGRFRARVSGAPPWYRARSGSGDAGTWLVADVPDERRALNRALAGLVSLNVAILRALALRGVGLPPLYKSGVRYEREPLGREWWQTVIDNLAEREGDCEDLGSHRAAELVFAGELGARAECIRSAPRVFHCVTMRADGTIEDPSAALGMRPLSALQRERALREVTP